MLSFFIFPKNIRLSIISSTAYVTIIIPIVTIIAFDVNVMYIPHTNIANATIILGIHSFESIFFHLLK